MKRAIVTGATGFVGANLARRLLHDGHEVHLLVRPEYQAWRIADIQPHVHVHEVQLTDSDAVLPLMHRIKPDWIFHLAAYGAYSSQTNVKQMLATNITATATLVEACLETGFESFINTGSSSEYGFKDHPPTEEDWLDPNSYYAVTKASATMFCRYTARSRGVSIPTLRLYSVYGPFEEPTRLIPTLIMRGLASEFPPLVNPETARDYVYVDDVMDAYLLAATHPGQDLGAVYNVGTGIQTSLREVVDVARDVLNITTEAQWGTMPGRIWDTSVWVADPHAIKETLDWTPQYSFESGFRRTVEWLQENPDMQQFYARMLSLPR